MDKFGILKLLNSFFDFYRQKSSDLNSKEQKQDGQNADLFSNLLNNLSQKKEVPQNKQETNVSTAPHPLQADMLNTINSHDAFINRVKQKNPQ